MACKLVKEQRRRRKTGEIRGAGSTRVVFVSSFMQMGGVVDLNDLQLERGRYSGFRGYCASKLENVLTARNLNSILSRYCLTEGLSSLPSIPLNLLINRSKTPT